jgi:hypothetical protein
MPAIFGRWSTAPSSGSSAKTSPNGLISRHGTGLLESIQPPLKANSYQSISCAAMDDKASAKEILDDLTRLSQAGRLRHMKTLDQDDLIAVLGLSLQASDDSSNALKRGREASAARAEKKVKTKSK